MLEKRREQLILLLEERSREYENSIPGSLHVVVKNGKKPRAQFYRRLNPKDKSGKYLKTSERDIAEQLAQKDYNKKLISVVRDELCQIEKLLKANSRQSITSLYSGLSDERKKLIKPVYETDESYVSRWMKDPYNKEYLEESKQFFTKRKEYVRSKSEVIIANMLFDYGIPYKYEKPIEHRKIVLAVPDFTVLNVKLRKQFYWEHMGMMDNKEYMSGAIRKIEKYEKQGIFPGENLIITFESSEMPVNIQNIDMMIKKYLL